MLGASWDDQVWMCRGKYYVGRNNLCAPHFWCFNLLRQFLEMEFLDLDLDNFELLFLLKCYRQMKKILEDTRKLWLYNNKRDYDDWLQNVRKMLWTELLEFY